MSTIFPAIDEFDAQLPQVGYANMNHDEWLKWDYEGGLTEWVDDDWMKIARLWQDNMKPVAALAEIIGTEKFIAYLTEQR
jgi:hypothetical protein